MAREAKKLSGTKKAAIFLISMGPEYSAKILKNFKEAEIEKISSEIANTTTVDSELKNSIIEEFLQLNDAQNYIASGGIKYARELLESTLGPQKASEIIKKLTHSSQIRPFSALKKTDPEQLFNFISKEHPQTIALILSYVEPDKSAVILNLMPEKMQSEIARRIATMDRTSPEIIKEVEAILEKKLSSVVTQDFTSAGGIETLVDILNSVDRGTEKSILEDLEQEDVNLAEEIKKRMFIFEDIITLDDTAIRRVLREVDFKDLAYALKGSSEEVAERIYKNLSTRAADMLKEDIELLGPVRIREVETSQQKIVQVIRKLDETGEIIISRGGEDAIVV
ncbi:flagellar motor switch protein FliG [Desulfonispora thiosulfatigenes DSM 11270]|uniref:Flagellar motor switch protein FliG n=1 Tax=Desulfonispora thiosulfatigenes DSM 11270 TaxID=656914 RepID=A0A1W1UN30_DESTI|nr:flagellar motor switch protein FliG [Desulfonispora thiosulfatigenes]SMB82480.1 flagellar motor switch protein FliG [Desulfonispora thiosulfatigenes DSM 11270]